MIKSLLLEQKTNITYFFDHISEDVAEKVLDQFFHCTGKIIFCGVGKSGYIAQKLAKTFLATGTKAAFLSPLDALHGDISLVEKEDHVVLLSKSGSTKELVDLLPFLRDKKVFIHAWVSNQKAPLLKKVDLGVFLPVKEEICPYDLSPTTSTAVQLIFGDILAVALMKKKKVPLDHYQKNHPSGAIGKKSTLTVDDIMITGNSLPICKSTDTLFEVLVELSNKKCGCILVIEESIKKQKLLGIFTDGDLRRALQQGASKVLHEKMGDLMTKTFLSVKRGALLKRACDMMQQDPKKWITILPVMEEGNLLGLVRMHDIVQQGIS